MSLLTVGDPRRTHGATALRPEPTRHVEPRPDLRIVTVPRRRLRVGLLSSILIVTFFVGIFALAAMHSLVVQAQFELDRIDEQVATRRNQIDARRVEVAELESPAAIVEAADDLGMVSPTDVVYLRPNER
jgi:cell division protein FtsL